MKRKSVRLYNHVGTNCRTALPVTDAGRAADVAERLRAAIANAVVILEKDKMDPKAGRVFGPMPRELAERGYQKIISLAPEVI